MMNKRYDVVTVLDTCVDLIMQGGDVVPRFGQAEQLVDDYHLEIGGSACLFACQCAKLALRTAGAGRVGKDVFGAMVLQRLSLAGMDAAHIAEEPGLHTGLGLALCRKEGDRAILTVPGSIDFANPEALLELLPRARHLHVASYYLLAGMRAHWPAILREAKRLGLTVSLDTNWDPMEKWDGLNELAPYIDILFPNDTELLAFTGLVDPLNAAAQLAKRVPLVAAKLGAEGALAVRSNGEVARRPANQVSVADTVGAGDTFDAGFLYGYLNGRSLDECLRAGVFCAGRSVTKPGGFMGQPVLSELAEMNPGL